MQTLWIFSGMGEILNDHILVCYFTRSGIVEGSLPGLGELTISLIHCMRRFRGVVTSICLCNSAILAFFKIICPGSKHQRKMNLSFLVHRSAQNRRQTYWERKLMNWEKLMELLKNWKLIMVFHVGKLFQSTKVLLLENQYMFRLSSSLGKV